METKFNFKSQICTDKVQSERLLALGLKKETADCYWFYCDIAKEWKCTILSSTQVFKDYPTTVIPAWSLGRLVKDLMPKCVMAHSSGDDSPRLHPYVPKFYYQGVTIWNIDETLAEFYQHYDLFGNLIDCIEWLIKEGCFNKEYLV